MLQTSSRLERSLQSGLELSSNRGHDLIKPVNLGCLPVIDTAEQGCGRQISTSATNALKEERSKGLTRASGAT